MCVCVWVCKCTAGLTDSLLFISVSFFTVFCHRYCWVLLSFRKSSTFSRQYGIVCRKTASKIFVFRNAKQICLAHSWIFIKCKFLKKFQLINAIFDYQLFAFSSFLLSRTLEIFAFSWDEMMMRFKSLALFFQRIGQTSHRNWAAERWIPCINLNFYRAKL